MVKSLNRGLLSSCWCQEEPSDILLHCRWLTFEHRHEGVTWNKKTLLVGKRRSGGSLGGLGSMVVLVGCANKRRWGQWCYAGYSGARKQRDYITFLSKVLLHCLPASKVVFVPCDRFIQGSISLRYRYIGQPPRETGSVMCRIALLGCLGSLSLL